MYNKTYNTIILRHGIGEITQRGDAIFGVDANAVEVKRWNICDLDAAREELSRHRCRYRTASTFAGCTVVQADEWALEFCECDSDGEFESGSDFDLADVYKTVGKGCSQKSSCGGIVYE